MSARKQQTFPGTTRGKKRTADVRRGVSPLTVEQLETGLRLLGRGDVDQIAFWDENIAAFRHTVLLAIRDTSDALLSPRITLRWRIELEWQLEALVTYIEMADRYVARSSANGPSAGELRPLRPHLH